MYKRNETRLVQNNKLSFGNSNKITIQSMCTYKTSYVDKIIKQINECKKAGANLMRVSVLDDKDADALKTIVKSVDLPIVADIHFNYEYAIKAIKARVSKIRINPGNINNIENIKKIIKYAKKYNTIIRIGINYGSIDSKINGNNKIEKMVNSALNTIKIFENENFYNTVVSLKCSDPIDTINAYKMFARLSNYPLHIGVTESGYDEIGIIRSVCGLTPVLLEGLGNTIRISLTNDPIKEIITCKRLLHELKLFENYPTIITCPTCGRCQVRNTKKLADKILNYCIDNKKYIKIAIMGCIVNGIGEGKDADIGLAGGKNIFIIFKKGKKIKTIRSSEAFNEICKEIDKF